MKTFAVTVAVIIGLCATVAEANEIYRGHGIAMHGDLKYPADFEHFDYVNPKAPKGGEVRRSAIGGFDTFNPFVIRGRAAAGATFLYDTLMVSSDDEPFSMYGLVAESVEMPNDRSWVTFHLNPKARWHDGKPITVEDVIWTFNTLIEKGQPFYRFYYGNVERVEKTGERSVTFAFKPIQNRELPLIMGQLPVLPKHYWESRDFEAATLEPPLGSGPYRVRSFDANRSVTYERVEDYWAADLPVRVGEFNFDTVRFDYYRDSTVALEAFKAGDYDFRLENSAKDWATSYDVPALRAGHIVKRTYEHDRPSGMQGFVFNLRRPLFQDPRVRRALDYAFDFEWTNKALFYGQYTRAKSFFDNSELASSGLPQGDELALLEPFRDKLPPEVFTTEYTNPTTDGEANIRENLRVAHDLLRDAGWQVDPRTRILTHQETGREFRFELMLVSPLFERIALPFRENLRRLGIDMRVRTVDTAQYQDRLNNYNFDMIVGSWGQSQSPGNEQREFWGSDAAERPGSRNYAGIQDPAIDALIEKVIEAEDRESLIIATNALDRALLWNFIVIPQWHIPYDRLAYWNIFGQPEVVPSSGVQFWTWWIDPEKTSVRRARRSAPASQ